jgi:hypothetical protein
MKNFGSVSKFNFNIGARAMRKIRVEQLEVSAVAGNLKILFKLFYLFLDWMRSTYWSFGLNTIPIFINPSY